MKNFKDIETCGPANLLGLMEKNEKLVNLSQASFARDKKNLAKEFSGTESLYQKQMDLLTDENTVYKKEIARLGSKIGSLEATIQVLSNDLCVVKSNEIALTYRISALTKENESVQGKLADFKSFHKQKTSSLQKSLDEAIQSSTSLQSEFSKVLKSPLPSKKPENFISTDQLAALLKQKKVLEDLYLNEKKILIRENSAHLKTILNLQKQIEYDLEKRLGAEAGLKKDVNLLVSDLERANEEIGRLKKELENIGEVHRAEVNKLNQNYLEREEDFLDSWQRIEEEFEEYKEFAEELERSKEENDRKVEVIDVMMKNFAEIKGMYEDVTKVLYDIVEGIKKSNEIIRDINVVHSEPQGFEKAQINKLLVSVEKIQNDVQIDRAKAEKLSNHVLSLLSEHQLDVISKEKESIEQFLTLSNENLNLNQKLLNKIQSDSIEVRTKKALPKISEDPEFATESQKIGDFLKNLKKKKISNEKKQRCELEAWELREVLYKKSIKSLSDQFAVLSSQSLSLKRLEKQVPELKVLENALKKSELSQLPEVLSAYDLQKSFFLSERSNFLECISKLQHLTSSVFSYFEFPDLERPAINNLLI